MAGTGGYREGAGRPHGAKNKANLEVKTLLDECVDWSVLISKLVELSNGVEVQVPTLTGPKVYTDKPDAFAAKVLLEYRFGKPQQRIEHSGEITEVVISKTIITKPADNK